MRDGCIVDRGRRLTLAEALTELRVLESAVYELAIAQERCVNCARRACVCATADPDMRHAADAAACIPCAACGDCTELMAPEETRAQSRCPGCGDRGDLAHVLACTRRALAARSASTEDALRFMLRKQIERRGAVDVTAIARAIVHGAAGPRRGAR